MQDLNFLFKQTRSGQSSNSTDNTFGYPENGVCVVSSSVEGNYVKFNNKVFQHFGINPEQNNYVVFGVNPTNNEVTFVIVSEDELDYYPKANTNKIQKGAANKGFIRIGSKPSVLALVTPSESTDEEGNVTQSWNETMFNVSLLFLTSVKEEGEVHVPYITIGTEITNDGDEEAADIFEEVNETADLPFA